MSEDMRWLGRLAVALGCAEADIVETTDTQARTVDDVWHTIGTPAAFELCPWTAPAGKSKTPKE